MSAKENFRSLMKRKFLVVDDRGWRHYVDELVCKGKLSIVDGNEKKTINDEGKEYDD
jgi:hypothetical protein